MKDWCRSAVLVLAAAGCAFPAGMSIGVASSIGGYSVDNAIAQGATELSDGSRLQTQANPSRMMLANGVSVLQATRSSSRVYGDKVVLENGALRVSRFDSDFAVEVHGLSVRADGPNTQAIVRTEGKTVEIASLGGGLEVRDAGAGLVRVAAGTKMSFAQDSTSSGQTQTGAKPVPTGTDADNKALMWSIVAIAGAAVAFGSVAAYEGKNPF